MENSFVFLACIVHLKKVDPRCFGKLITLLGDGTWKEPRRRSRLLMFSQILLLGIWRSLLRALESLMTEFFHDCTTNERKREIGKWNLGKRELIPLSGQTCMCPLKSWLCSGFAGWWQVGPADLAARAQWLVFFLSVKWESLCFVSDLSSVVERSPQPLISKQEQFKMCQDEPEAELFFFFFNSLPGLPLETSSLFFLFIAEECFLILQFSWIKALPQREHVGVIICCLGASAYLRTHVWLLCSLTQLC